MQAQEIKLGFGPIPRHTYIFVKQEANCCWYMLADDDTKLYVQERALTGTIQRLIIKDVETSFGKDIKADLEVLADRRYVIRSGFDSNFTKGLLLGINARSIDQLRQPVTITVTPGDRQTVFCHLYDPQTLEEIRVGWEKEADWESQANRAIAKLDQAHGRQTTSQQMPLQKQQTKPQPDSQLSQPQQQAPAPAQRQQTQTQVASAQEPLVPRQEALHYPQNNAVVRAIRTRTGHSAEDVIAWLKERDLSSPDKLSSVQLRQLVDALVLGWAKGRLQSDQNARTSYLGAVESRLAAGVPLQDAAIAWIESQSHIPVT